MIACEIAMISATMPSIFFQPAPFVDKYCLWHPGGPQHCYLAGHNSTGVLSGYRCVVGWQIKAADNQPFEIASIWDQWTDGTTGEVVVSFSMLTINAAQHPVMRTFHKPEDEKRTPLVLASEHYMKWLEATTEDAREALRIDLMPELMAAPTL